MRINDVSGSLIEREQQTRIVAQHFEHEALHLFNDRRNGNLADAEIAMWNRLYQLMQTLALMTLEPL